MKEFVLNISKSLKACVIYTSLPVCMSVSGCDDVVGPEGMEKFCEDIGVEPENVKHCKLDYILGMQSVVQLFISLHNLDHSN